MITYIILLIYLIPITIILIYFQKKRSANKNINILGGITSWKFLEVGIANTQKKS